MEHEPLQDRATLRRQRIENILIGGATLVLFIVALMAGLHHDLVALFSRLHVSETLSTSQPLTRSFGAVPRLGDDHQAFDGILMFGLFASLGLTAFAVVQYQRLRAALSPPAAGRAAFATPRPA
ncbi:hypothetical protein [Rhizobium sp. G21]|uniref:hypothetical protein n=1 Tax=Rhizobium sp. G21 TaxID=2758439 RepID=UPI0016034C74|nr:hypothetical protein [Rhizobium sp. G21]MBB1249720.1 hypothetical protein [Rhizobium sp. G21]